MVVDAHRRRLLILDWCPDSRRILHMACNSCLCEKRHGLCAFRACVCDIRRRGCLRCRTTVYKDHTRVDSHAIADEYCPLDLRDMLATGS
jgi:hypothetical protein